MKKETMLWMIAILIFIAIITIPDSNQVFTKLTEKYPYIMGFIKFAYLASLGELLAIRINKGNWCLPGKMFFRSIIWGVIGIAVTLMFKLFASGVFQIMEEGYLPGGTNVFLFALFTATIMNTTFGPVFMACHRCSDTYLEMKTGREKIGIGAVVKEVDWNNFITFVILKTIPFFWIPAHTITFLLPSAYRVLMAAFLSIVLGVILSLAKKKK
jgi:hypothetical protein